MFDNPQSREFETNPGARAPPNSTIPVLARDNLRYLLLVDDDPLIRMMFYEFFSEFGWTVTTAATAEEALAINSDGLSPSILITDIDLGLGMDGFEFGPKARDRWPEIAIVYISGRPPSPDRIDGLGFAEKFVMKPVRPVWLLREIEDLADRKQKG
jgi:DNA-binding response OmpR family regulator